VGATVQLYRRNYANQAKTALLWNVGWQRYYPDQQFRVGLALSHFGTYLGSQDTYSDPFPKLLILGITKKLAHLPLELHLDGQYQSSTGHIRACLGGEFTITEKENLFLRFGITSDRFDQQTQVANGDFFAGGSAGFGVRIKSIQIDYGLQTFGGAGFIQAITLQSI